jgi:hypothetical protein
VYEPGPCYKLRTDGNTGYRTLVGEVASLSEAIVDNGQGIQHRYGHVGCPDCNGRHNGGGHLAQNHQSDGAKDDGSNEDFVVCGFHKIGRLVFSIERSDLVLPEYTTRLAIAKILRFYKFDRI